jgi:hypothetical protein
VLVLNIFLRVRLVFALPLGIVMTFLLRKIKLKKALRIAWKGVAWELVLAIVGIMIFRQMIETSGVIDSVASYLQRWDVPTLFMITVIPFLTGVLTGSEIASIGISFPLVLPMIQMGSYLPIVSTAYISAFLGCFISPLHPCVAFTFEYFKPNTGKIYRKLIPSIMPIYFASLLLAIFL